MIATYKIHAIVGLTVLAASQSAIAQEVGKRNDPKDVREIRETMNRWNDAYRRLDAESLASLEAASIDIVDRFGELHRLTSNSEKEAFWANGFAMIARGSKPPELTFDEIHLISRTTATAHACAQFSGGIRLEDGAQIPPLWELNSYLLVKMKGEWRIAELGIHDQTPTVGGINSKVLMVNR